MLGKYYNDYYVIGGSPAIDKFGNKTSVFWITWLDNGSHTSGYTSAIEAARAADRIVENQLIREKARDIG